mgnify:CR=1 FL=1
MAEKVARFLSYSIQPMSGVPGVSVGVWEWGHDTAIVTADTCRPVVVSGLSDRMVTAYGDYTGGGSVAIKGCARLAGDVNGAVVAKVAHDNEQMLAVTDPQAGTAISFSADGHKQVLEAVNQMSWTLTGTVAALHVLISGTTSRR